MANSTVYRCSSWTHGGQHCCSNHHLARRDVIEPIVLRGTKRDLLSDEALQELHRYVAEQQHAKRAHRGVAQREVREVESAIDRVTSAIAETGLSRALREKLASLERQRDELERGLRGVADPVELVPRLGDRWRAMIDGIEDLAKRPAAHPHEIEEARERLRNLIGRVRLMPKDGTLFAHVGLRMIEVGPEAYTGVVAGGRFSTLPVMFNLAA